jgi:UDP-N-acetylglucosamine--N-acetylmuramyl-(pentapeptide) pyrophosphoryl-undecaprenol N-acetylglucosamine transferase
MPALALAAALEQERPDVEPVLVGARRGVEADLLPARPFRYHLLPAEPIHRRQWWRNLRWPLLLPKLLRACRDVLDREAPSLVVGTGGYAAGPILRMAVHRGIPLALQEQNAFPGITTRRLARRARQIHLGFPEAARHLRTGPGTHVHTLGNPITPPPASTDRRAARAALDLPPRAPVVLVMGGSQGARAINAAVSGALDLGALDEIVLLWSTGRHTYELYRRHHRPPWCHVRPFWDPIGDVYAATDLAVARAGAMTVSEFAAWGLPSILIPLPTAAADHQSRNARALEAARRRPGPAPQHGPREPETRPAKRGARNCTVSAGACRGPLQSFVNSNAALY